MTKQYATGHEAFLALVECRALYTSRHDMQVAASRLVTTNRTAAPEVLAGVRLGIIYAKRVYSDDSATELREEITEALRDIEPTHDISRIARVVDAVIILLREQDYGTVIELLSVLHEECRFDGDARLYGIVRRWMGLAHGFLGEPSRARLAYDDALAVFRRYNMALSCAATMNDYAFLRLQLGEYVGARVMLLDVMKRLDSLGLQRNRMLALTNMGIAFERIGNWSSAERCYRDAIAFMDSETEDGACLTPMRSTCIANLQCMRLLRRQFFAAEYELKKLRDQADGTMPGRVLAVINEILGELYTECGKFTDADRCFDAGMRALEPSLRESDVYAELLRRRAQLLLETQKLDDARSGAIDCIRLCKKIGEPYELGASIRVLGEIYAARGDANRAAVCFAAAAGILRDIHERYELMRTLYAHGKLLGRFKRGVNAETALLAARQLAEKLDSKYYQALIAVALSDAFVPQQRFDEASTWLAEATSRRDNLEGVDRERVDSELSRVASELQVAITRASVRAAETLKTICRVYEDARFPIAELKPDLAYQVAQSVGGESMFVAARKGGGFHIPLTYNIAANEAKELLRRLDGKAKKTKILGLKDEPIVLATPDNRTLIAVPCHVTFNGTEPHFYAVCTRFPQIVTASPRQLEILCASSEALARLIEDGIENRVRSKTDGDDEPVRIRHPRGSFKDILTIDPAMIKVIRMAERAAGSVAPILLEGETGVGKELFARAIHGSSRRKDGPFVAVNAGGMSVHLLESELFGHVKGAFTGANNDRVGFIDTARGGTLFLDEVGEMSEELQVKLLRLLENGEYRRLGESAVRQADVRVVSATNRDLKKAVDGGSFRRDLYYRLSPVRLTIPPLRLRSRDIQLMVRHFLRECAAMNGIADRYIEIDVKAMEALELYNWPGNVRELHNEILRVVSLIGKADLVRFPMLSENIKDYLKKRGRGDGLLERSVEQYERRLILDALHKHDWNRMRTADAIGVPRTTLLAKLKRLNVASR